MYDKIVIKQPAGLGDIFFSLKAAYTLHKGFNCGVVWPLIPQYEWVKDYIKYPFIQFVSQEEDYPLKNKINEALFPKTSIVPDIRVLELEENNKKYILVPLQHADWVAPGMPVMEAKYQFVNLDSKNWQEFFEFERNTEKENKLYYEVLGLTDDSDYTLVNRRFASPPDTQIFPNVDVSKFSNYIEMSYIEGYTIFDWCKVIENANGISTIDTSIQYIIEKLNTKAKFYHCYLRKGNYTYFQIKDLFTTPWVFLNKENN